MRYVCKILRFCNWNSICCCDLFVDMCDVFHNLIDSLSFNSPFHGLVNIVDLLLHLFCILLCFLKPNKSIRRRRSTTLLPNIFTPSAHNGVKTLHKKHLLTHTMILSRHSRSGKYSSSTAPASLKTPWGSRVGAVVERSPPTNVARVRFPESVSYVG